MFTTQAQKDARKIARSGLRDKAEELLELLRKNPRQGPPPFEKLVGDLAGAYSRRINIQHRLVYQVLDDVHTVKVIRMWTHYEQARRLRVAPPPAAQASSARLLRGDFSRRERGRQPPQRGLSSVVVLRRRG